MSEPIKAIYAPNKRFNELTPGDWRWYSEGDIARAGIQLCFPNREVMSLDRRWAFTFNDGLMTVTPSIWINAEKGEALGEWHGWIIDGYLIADPL
jgi:hypothetical protein